MPAPVLKRIGLLVAVVLLSAAALLAPVDRVWTGGTGDWDNPDNWNPPGIPGTNPVDVATIDAGTVTLGTSYTIAGLSVGEAVLDASQDLTVSGSLHLAGGTLTGSADLSADALVMSGGLIAEDAEDCCAIVIDGTLELSGADPKHFSREVQNLGTATWTGGDLDFTGGSFTNAAGASFTVTSTGITGEHALTGGVFQNAGSFIYGAEDCCARSIAAAFTNRGTVDVTQGLMKFEDCCKFTQEAGGALAVAAPPSKARCCSRAAA